MQRPSYRDGRDGRDQGRERDRDRDRTWRDDRDRRDDRGAHHRDRDRDGRRYRDGDRDRDRERGRDREQRDHDYGRDRDRGGDRSRDWEDRRVKDVKASVEGAGRSSRERTPTGAHSAVATPKRWADRGRSRSRSPARRRDDGDGRRDRDRPRLDPDADASSPDPRVPPPRPSNNAPTIAPVTSLPKPRDERVPDASERLPPQPSGSLVDVEMEAGQEEEDEDELMKRMMGFSSLKTTRGTQVEGNEERGTASVEKPRTWRQYMNRRGGFNRLLDKV